MGCVGVYVMRQSCCSPSPLFLTASPCLFQRFRVFFLCSSLLRCNIHTWSCPQVNHLLWVSFSLLHGGQGVMGGGAYESSYSQVSFVINLFVELLLLFCTCWLWAGSFSWILWESSSLLFGATVNTALSSGSPSYFWSCNFSHFQASYKIFNLMAPFFVSRTL